MSPKRVTRPLDIYVRVSDVRGRAGDSFISPKDQDARCRALAEARGYHIGEVFTDLDVSGGKMARPELDNAIARIEEGSSAGILCAKMDRFARTLLGGLQTLERINELGGVVIIADGEFDTSTAQGELVLNMMLTLAQFELRRIGEAWFSARGQAVDRGIHVSRHVPPGYTRLPKSSDNATDRRLVPDPVHAETIREAFSMAANGEPYIRIANFLTEKKLPIAGNGDSVWESYRIRRLLANRVYLGEARSGKAVNAEAHDPIVSQSTWTLAQREQAPALTEHVETLLAGLCRCASCSFAMGSQKARGTTVATYRCSTNTVHGRCPGPSTISASRLEGYVIARFLERASVTLEPVEEADDGAAETAVEAERAYRSVLLDTDLRRQIGENDHSALIAKLHKEWQDALAAVPQSTAVGTSLGSTDLHALVTQLQERGDVLGLRDLLASAIQAVFVRPAASRSHSLPIEDRVRIVWKDEPKLELPKRGERFEPRAFAW
jgi:DNA invertase Pin-like site-specific DNA recombinase